MEDDSRQDFTKQIVESGVIAVIRMDDPETAVSVVEAIRAGGISCIEITMTTPGALDLIEQLSEMWGDEADFLLGAGSVRDAGTVRKVVQAGARYVVSPIFPEAFVEAAHEQGVPAIPGAFSPTEIQRSYEAGADLVKVFPASTVGPSYFKSVLGPLPHLRLVPTGGVTVDNAGDWIRVGARAVGAGSALLDEDAVAAGDFDRLTENARGLRRAVAEAREA